MRIIKMGLICLGCLCIACLSAQENSRLPLSTLSNSELIYFQEFVQGNNRFAFDLYQELKQHSGNIYFSSYSIATGLGIAALGAKGETAQQFQHVFRYPLPLLLFSGDINQSLQSTSDAETSQVLLTNALWLDKDVFILPSFKQALLRNFRAILEPIDFANNQSQSIQKINQWVSQQSGGKVHNIVSAQDVNINTRMILTTAAYLKGQWVYPFEPKLTKRQPFQISAQRTLLVNMMQNTSHYLLWKGEKWEMLAMPYAYGEQGARLAMAILLPKKNISLNELEKNLTWDHWRQWKSLLKSETVVLTLPSFHIDKHLDLETVLKAMGLGKIFNLEADFSGITTEKGIYLNAVLHKTSIKVDEKGSDVKVMGGIKTAASIENEIPYEFIVDRPFIFIIWDQNTDSILFMGRLTLP